MIDENAKTHDAGGCGCFRQTVHSVSIMVLNAFMFSVIFICFSLSISAVCLELLLLLHEIEDHRVLNAPLTSISVGPSAPPLLLASMTSFSLVASPIAFLQSMTHDLLQTVIDLPALPNPDNPVERLADLESLMCSLSSCIYHGLCGGDDDRLLVSIKKGETELVGKQMKDGKKKEED